MKTRVRASDTLTWTLPLRLLSHITYHSILFIVVYYKGQSGVDGLHFYIVPEHNRIQLRLPFLQQVYIPSSSTKQTKYLMLFILSAQRHVISVSTWWTRLTHRMCLPRLRVELTGKEIAGFLWHVLLFLCATRHCNKTTTGSTCTVWTLCPHRVFTPSQTLYYSSFIHLLRMTVLYFQWNCYSTPGLVSTGLSCLTKGLKLLSVYGTDDSDPGQKGCHSWTPNLLNNTKEGRWDEMKQSWETKIFQVVPLRFDAW